MNEGNEWMLRPVEECAAMLDALLARATPAPALDVERLREQMALLVNVPHSEEHPCTACRRDGLLAALDAARLATEESDPETVTPLPSSKEAG